MKGKRAKKKKNLWSFLPRKKIFFFWKDKKKNSLKRESCNMKIWKMEREGLFRNFLTIIMVGNCCWHQCIGMVSFSSFGCTLLSVNFLFLFDNFLFSTAVRCLNLEYTVAYSQCCETKIQLFFFLLHSLTVIDSITVQKIIDME